MEDIRSYLEKLNADNWERLRKNPPSCLNKIGREITTEKMDQILAEHFARLCSK